MALVKLIILVATTMALSITLLTTRTETQIDQTKEEANVMQQNSTLHASKRLNRFLADTPKPRNPRAADHCHKDAEICYYLEGVDYTCCNNKCVNLETDHHNCGACKKKCPFTHTCCRGECVLLSLDKRHCGMCNNRCPDGKLCVYGMCDYP